MAVETWKRTSLEKNRATYQSPTSSLAEPEVLVITAQVPETGSTTFRATIKVVRGDVDADGNPRPARTIITREVRFPVANDAADISQCDSILNGAVMTGTILSDLAAGVVPQTPTLDLDISRPI